MTDELNPTGDEIREDELNQEGDSEDEDLKFLDTELENEPEESKEPDGSKEALDIYNAELKKRGLNKNYKSWDDVAKSEKQRDIDFAKKGVEKQKEEPKEEVTSNPDRLLIKELQLKLDAPESKYVIDEIKKEHPGKDPYEIWNSSEYYKREAAIRAENERNKQRIANPSGNSEGQQKEDEMSKKFMKNFPPSVQKAMDRMKKA